MSRSAIAADGSSSLRGAKRRGNPGQRKILRRRRAALDCHGLRPRNDEHILAAFNEKLTALGPFGRVPHLAIALSGGADSLALTLLAQHWAQTQGGRITALTVDHALRPESREEAERVAVQMQRLGIAHEILTPPHAAVSNNLQEAARQWRYDALADWCRAHDVLHCLLGHHAGDQRETVALMQARGDTADGDAGMSAVRNYRGVRFLRPLLTFEKDTLIGFLEAQGLTWIEDPTNQNRKFARVRVRQDGVSTQPDLATIAAQGAARAAREEALAAVAVQLVTLYPTGYAEFDAAGWAALPATLAQQLLADLLTTISGRTHRPRQAETVRLFDVLHSTPEKKRTLHGCEITRRGNTIRIAREWARVAPPVLLNGSGQLPWDERFWVTHHLGAEALTLRALGRNKLGLPPATPSLWHLEECVFVPHITQEKESPSVTIGFAPAKPLAAAPFWWLNKA